MNGYSSSSIGSWDNLGTNRWYSFLELGGEQTKTNEEINEIITNYENIFEGKMHREEIIGGGC